MIKYKKNLRKRCSKKKKWRERTRLEKQACVKSIIRGERKKTKKKNLKRREDNISKDGTLCVY